MTSTTPRSASSAQAVGQRCPPCEMRVGSLSVNPADSSLLMGTNTGLFRIADGTSEPEKVTGGCRRRAAPGY
jgi:hypothetical protein